MTTGQTTPSTITVDAFLADSVAAAEGKLYGHGIGWNSIYAASFPTRHPRIGIGLLIHVPYTATNQTHRLRVQIVDADGQAIRLGDHPEHPGDAEHGLYELGGEFALGRPPLLPPGDEQIAPIAMNIDSIVFTEPQIYNVVTEIDGTEVHRTPFRVQHLSQAPPGLVPR